MGFHFSKQTTHTVTQEKHRDATMPEYTLHYFDMRGRAELIRFIFAVAEVKYQDHRMSREEFFGDFKSRTPYGQVPVLEIDGKMVCQSNSIARYLARTFNLAGSGLEEQLRADMIVDCMEDIIRPLMQVWRQKDPALKAEMKIKY